MKIDVSEAKRWVVINVDGKLYSIVDVGHTHMGRWGATYTLKARDILTGQNNTLTYKSGTAVENADVSRSNATYLYTDGSSYSFMESDTGEIHDIDEGVIEDSIRFLKENLDVYLMKYNDNVIGIILPATISYKVAKTLDGDRGNRANAGKKSATLENWLEVMISDHVNEWATVTINTDTGSTS